MLAMLAHFCPMSPLAGLLHQPGEPHLLHRDLVQSLHDCLWSAQFGFSWPLQAIIAAIFVESPFGFQTVLTKRGTLAVLLVRHRLQAHGVAAALVHKES